VLLVPALWWMRRARRSPASPGGHKVPGSALAFIALFVAAQLAALSAPLWAPSSAFGKWMSTDAGRLTFVGIAGGAVIGIGLLLILVAACFRALARK
jgi:hypothetical protein